MKIIKLIFNIVLSILLIALILYFNFIISGKVTSKIIYFIVSSILIIFIIKKLSFSNLIIILILWILFNKIPYINSLLEHDFQLDKGGKFSTLTQTAANSQSISTIHDIIIPANEVDKIFK